MRVIELPFLGFASMTIVGVISQCEPHNMAGGSRTVSGAGSALQGCKK